MGDSEGPRILHILSVEDDPTDIRLLHEALKESESWCYMSSARNGAEALDILFQRGKYKSRKLPDLIILDLNLPIITGHEVLLAVKANDTLASIPVLVLSTSQNPNDINKAYDNGAACYIIKPRTFEELSEVAGAIRDFWYEKASLPNVIPASNPG